MAFGVSGRRVASAVRYAVIVSSLLVAAVRCGSGQGAASPSGAAGRDTVAPTSVPIGTARVEADPPALSLSRDQRGVTTIRWTNGGNQTAQVWVSHDGDAEVLFAEGPSGTSEASWIVAPGAYRFTLYAGQEHSMKLADTIVRATPK